MPNSLGSQTARSLEKTQKVQPLTRINAKQRRGNNNRDWHEWYKNGQNRSQKQKPDQTG